MIGSGLSGRHVLLIAGFTVRHALRTGAGIIYLMLALGFGLYSAHIMLQIADSEVVDQIRQQQAQSEAMEARRQAVREGRDPDETELVFDPDAEAPEKVDGMLQMAQPVVKWAVKEHTGSDAEAAREADKRAEEWTEYLLGERPAFLSALFMILLIGMPFVIPFGAFNQTSGDIGTKGLRYLLLRTERVNVFLGRYLGTAAFLIVVQALTILFVVTFVAFNVKVYETGDLAAWGLHGVVALGLMTLAYVALAAMLSACTDTPLASLALLKTCIGGVLLSAVILRNVALDAFEYLKWLLPWGIQNQLIAPEMTRVVGAGLACVGYALVFLFLGSKRFETRDL